MRLLFTGRGGAGSWEVRGRQLGAACGAVVQANATPAMCKAAELIVGVKRITPQLLADIRGSGRRWVFDAVDFYPQKPEMKWSKDQAIGWVRNEIARMDPSAVIWPTKRMMEDCSDGRPGMVLLHHHRPGIAVNPVRQSVLTVGYEGRTEYVGGWQAVIQRECKRRGWTFAVNPRQLADLDIVLALRGEEWKSYAATHWKSNVKLANAHASGTPFVGNRECGYFETASGCEYWADDAMELSMAFDWLTHASAREHISDRFRERSYPISQAADDLMGFLRGL